MLFGVFFFHIFKSDLTEFSGNFKSIGISPLWFSLSLIPWNVLAGQEIGKIVAFKVRGCLH